MPEMTAAKLRELCKKHDLYLTPAANDKLYANCCGFAALSGLEAYTNLKSLNIDCNALDSLEGLPPLPHLRCLYAQSNGLYTLEGLDAAPGLQSLNIEINCLSSLEGLDVVPELQTLHAANNRFETTEDLAALRGCLQIATLDLRNNKLDTEEGLIKLLQVLPELRCLYLRGNPVVSEMRNYRKRLVAALPGLTYLDDRPVFELERRQAEAWQRGGLEAEREAREQYRQEQKARKRADFDHVQEMRKAGWRKRRASLGLPPEDTDPFFEVHKLPKGADDDEADEPEALPIRRPQEQGASDDEAIEGVEEFVPLSSSVGAPPRDAEADFQRLMAEDPDQQQAEKEHAAQLAKLLKEDSWLAVQAAAAETEQGNNLTSCTAAPTETIPALAPQPETAAGDCPHSGCSTAVAEADAAPPPTAQLDPTASLPHSPPPPLLSKQQPLETQRPAETPAKPKTATEEVPLPEPKAPTGRLLAPAPKWQDNDSYEPDAQGFEVEEINEDEGGEAAGMGQSDGGAAGGHATEGGTAADAKEKGHGGSVEDAAAAAETPALEHKPQPFDQSTCTEERRRNLAESQQLLEALGQVAMPSLFG